MRTWLRGKLPLLFVVCAVLLAVPVVAAFADDVVNDVVASSNSKTITKGKSTVVKYWIQPVNNNTDGNPTNGAGQCNAADGAGLTLRINAPTGVTVDGGSSKNLTFNGCSTDANGANVQSVTFASNGAAGSYNIGDATYVSDTNSPAATYNFTTTDFSLDVAPFVSSTSPANGAATDTTIQATFSDAMTASSIDATTFKVVRNSNNTQVAGSFGPLMMGGTRATFTPSAPLAAGETYTVTVEGGDRSASPQDLTGVKSSNGVLLFQDSSTNPATKDKTWSFTTAAAPTSSCDWSKHPRASPSPEKLSFIPVR